TEDGAPETTVSAASPLLTVQFNHSASTPSGASTCSICPSAGQVSASDSSAGQEPVNCIWVSEAAGFTPSGVDCEYATTSMSSGSAATNSDTSTELTWPPSRGCTSTSE